MPVVAPEFLDRAIGWLLDRGPADLRTSPLRAYPVALAFLIEHHCELGAHVSAAELTVIQQALEAQGAQALATRREVALVREAVEQVVGGLGA